MILALVGIGALSQRRPPCAACTAIRLDSANDAGKGTSGSPTKQTVDSAEPTGGPAESKNRDRGSAPKES